MSRSALSFAADDISALARSLKDQLGRIEQHPGHVELLNMLARSIGFRNFQHYRSQQLAVDRICDPALKPPSDPVDMGRIQRMMRFFDGQARLMHWPSKLSQQQTCLWVLWSRLPRKLSLSEAEINRRLQAVHTFGDHALLRRWLCDYGMVVRTVDGRDYRRVERRPPPEALMLIGCITRRTREPESASIGAPGRGSHVQAG